MTSRVLFVTLSTALTMVQAITILEQSGSSYAPCTTDELTPFATKITTESNTCALQASYDWNSVLLPTITERKELCACTTLIAKLQTVKVPHCGFYRSNPNDFTGGFYSCKQLAEYAFGLCSTSGSSSTTTPTPLKTTASPYTVPTFAPVATFTYTPSFDLGTSNESASTKKSKSKTGVIVGVVIALVAVAVIVAFVVYKRKQHRTRESSHEERGTEAVVVDVGAPDELSPLGGDPFTNMPSPSAPPAKDM